jgi:hypothetical protein
MNLIKTLLAAVALVVTSQGATTAFSNLAATNTTVVTTPAVVNSLTLFSTNTTPTLVRLYDNAITVTNAAYTNYTSTVSTEVESFVGSNGITNAVTNVVVAIATSEHAAETIAKTPVVTVVVPANNIPVTITPRSIFPHKVVLSNNLAGVSGIITYRTP